MAGGGKYASDLLDGLDLLYKRTSTSLDSLEEIGKFVKKLSGVMSDYGKSLAKVAKEAQKSSKSVEQETGTLKTAWDTMLTNLDSLGEHHNKIATANLAELSTNILNYHKEKEKDRKRLVGEGMRLTKEVAAILETLKAAKKNYQKLSEEADKSQSRYLKSKNDPQVKPKDLQGFATKATQANDKASTADKEYQTALRTANQRQTLYYTQEQPHLLDEFQKFEEERETFVKQSLEKLCQAQNELPPFYQQVCAAIQKSVDGINKDADTDAFVRLNRTNVKAPAAIEYEAYEREAPGEGAVPPSRPTPVAPVSAGASLAPKNTPVANMGSGSTRKPAAGSSIGLGPADDSLSKEEKRTKLEGQLREQTNLLRSELKSYKGLDKMVKSYTNDPVAQEKARVPLVDAEKRLAGYREGRRRVLADLATVMGPGYKPPGDLAEDPDEEENGNAGPGPKGAATSHAPAANASGAPSTAPAPSGGAGAKAKGLYDYEATNDNELSFAEGDQLTITEQDDSGWWFAELNGKTGFIPSNYVELC